MRVEGIAMGLEFETVDGLRTRYRLHRNPGAPKLLMTNSLPQTIKCWDNHWEELGKTFEMLAIDLPGFGLSDERADLLSPSGASGFLAKAIEHWKFQNCIAVGPDIGVPVVLSLAQTRPELVSGLVIFDGPGYYPPVFSFDLRWTMNYGWFRKLAVATYRPDAYLKGVFARGYKKLSVSPEMYAEYREANKDKSAMQCTVTFLGTYPEELTTIGNALGSVKIPTLVVWGEEDVFVPVENGRELARRIPRSTLHVFKGCGHFSHEDAGDEFTEVLRDWVAKELRPAQA
jgi:pimeloyl-ACP methyl ester carboxylesterase